MGLVWSHDPESYAGSSNATGRASRARQAKGDDPDKNGYPGPPVWGFGVGLTTPHSKKLIVTKVEQSNKLEDRFNDDGWKRTRYTEITKGKIQGRMERRSRKRSSSAGSEKMERVGDR
jgi:hypothetical protein